jgi:signal transduction histidine kinase
MSADRPAARGWAAWRGWAAARGWAGWRAWPQRRLPARDIDRLLSGALLIWALFDVPWWWRPPGHAGSTLVILGTLGLAAAQSLPFLYRRTRPAGVLALAGAALAVKYAAHLNTWSASAAVLAAAYGLGAYGSRMMRQVTRLMAGAGLVTVLVALQAGRGAHSAAVACALLATALVLGEVTSSHRDIATAAARHAHDLDRASLARELHDVLAHQLSAIAVQAGAARLASSADPLAATCAIGTIEREARAGLTELNQLVHGMRESSAAGPGLPQLADLPLLVQQAKESGLRADLQVAGEPRHLGVDVELAGYRMVQESLTNTIRYAPGAAATVRVAYRADGIVVDVLDDGPGPPLTTAVPAAQGGGTGLAGLSERTRLLGGHLEAGGRPGGGFAVRAFLPGSR